MSLLYSKWNTIIVALLLFTSCSRAPSHITISGTFKEDCILICQIKKTNDTYHHVKHVAIEKNEKQQKIYISINPQDWENVFDIIFYFRGEEPNIISISSIEIDGISSIQSTMLKKSIVWTENIDIFFDHGKLQISQPAASQGAFSVNIRPFYNEWEPNILYLYCFTFIILQLLTILYFSFSIEHRNILFFAISLYLVLLPLKISWANWALGLLTTIIILSVLTKKGRFQFHPFFYFIILLYFTTTINFPHPTHLNASELISQIPLILFPILFSMLPLSQASSKNLCKTFAYTIVLSCLYSLIYFLILYPSLSSSILDFNSKKYSFLLFPYPLFSHASFISVGILMAIPIAFYLKKEKKINGYALLTITILICMVVMLSGTRIGLIIVPLVLLLSILFYIKIPQYFKYIVVAVCGIATLLIFKNPTIDETFSDPIRQDLRTTAIAAIKERPLFGWGTDSMETLLYSEDIAQKAGLEEPIAEYNHFHNQYLDMLVQFGFIGSIPFFALFIYLIYLAIKKKDFLLMAYLAIYLPFMWVESPFATAKGIQPMIFWLCFLVSTQKVRLDNEAVTPHPENKITSM